MGKQPQQPAPCPEAAGGARSYVTVEALGASSVDLKARAWVKTADYWSVFYDYNELIYSTLPSHGVNFPFPQMDVHLKNAPEA